MRAPATRRRRYGNRLLSAGLLIAALAAFGAGAAAVTAQDPYDGAKSNRVPHLLRHRVGSQPGSDWFLSYDGLGGVSQDNRDFPITIIWTKEATKYLVKHHLGLDQAPAGRPGPRGGLSILERIRKRATSTDRNNSSVGGKNECAADGLPPKQNVHVRFYGAPWNESDGSPSYLYDPTPTSSGGWRWFVVSSTHYDHAEERYRWLDDHESPPGGGDPVADGVDDDTHTPGDPPERPNPCFKDNKSVKWSGLSEEAANFVENRWVRTNDPNNNFGTLRCDQVRTRNYEGNDEGPPERAGECLPVPERREPEEGQTEDLGHYWQNDGLASLIEVND